MWLLATLALALRQVPVLLQVTFLDTGMHNVHLPHISMTAILFCVLHKLDCASALGDLSLQRVCMYILTKDRRRACYRFSDSILKASHSFMALGRARARTTALTAIPAID